VIPKDVFQIAQAELLTQLMDSMQSPPVDTMHDKIEARLNARLKAERQSQPEYRPSIHEVSWHLRAEATRAKRLGLELNKAAKMLPQVAGLLDWHARFNGNVPPKEVELIRDIFSVEGAPDAPQKMDREKMLRYLPTMMLVMYGRAAQEIMGKRADEVIFARSRRLITRFMGQKPLSQDL
jgi:hypothetical protein